MGLESAVALGSASLIGTGISAVGQYQSGVEAKKAGKAAKQAYDFNATLLEQKSEAEVQRELISEFKKGKIKDEIIGEQQAGYAKAGVITTTGSPIDVLTDSLANYNLDLQIDRYNSEIARRGLLSEAEMERQSGEAAYEEGQRKYKAGLISAASTIAKGAVTSGLIGSGSYDGDMSSGGGSGAGQGN
jgi:hypothetical protein